MANEIVVRVVSIDWAKNECIADDGKTYKINPNDWRYCVGNVVGRL